MPPKPNTPATASELRRRAEARLSGRQQDRKSDAATRHLLHELEVHQIELEMQNAELQKARSDLESSLEKYTDLYDFAPVGYFSMDESGVILEANLTGAALLGVERSRLIKRRLLLFVAPSSRPMFLDFLKKAFIGSKNRACEALLLKEGGGTFWAAFRATSAIPLKGPRNRCRVAFGDITARKEAGEAQRRVEALADTNRGLNREIARRRKVERALQKSEQHQRRLLRQSGQMQGQLRRLSHQILLAQEEERKRISRELHDVIAQTLTSINVRLAALKKEAALDTRGLGRSIARTQRLVERSVNIVHRFARELRPTVLDDLGLIPALHTYMKSFRERTGIHVSLSAFAAVNSVSSDKRTVLYRIAQEALTNVARHAKASEAKVKIQKLDGGICLRIEDNGKGFQKERTVYGGRNKRLGLLGMKERVEMVGGNFTIQSTPGNGTTVLATIPLADDRARRAALMEVANAKL